MIQCALSPPCEYNLSHNVRLFNYRCCARTWLTFRRAAIQERCKLTIGSSLNKAKSRTRHTWLRVSSRLALRLAANAQKNYRLWTQGLRY